MARPLKTKEYTGSVIGAAIGGLLGGPVGAGLGGVLGSAANPERKMPLREAIREAVEQRGLTFVSAEREGKFVIRVVFGDHHGRAYFAIRARIAPGRRKWTAEALADALYDQIVKNLNDWRKRFRT